MKQKLYTTIILIIFEFLLSMTPSKINFEDLYTSEKNIIMATAGDVMPGSFVNQAIHIKGY